MISLRFGLRRLARMNHLLTLAILALLCMGVAFIYSASVGDSGVPTRTLHLKQMCWAGGGLMVYFVIAFLDYRRWRGAPAIGLLLGALGLLVAVLAVGSRIYGARRWLMIGPIGLQPAELAKLAVVMSGATWLGPVARGDGWALVRNLLAALAVAAVPFALILRQPDLGTALMLVPAVGAMVFVAGLPRRLVLSVGVAGGLLVTLVLMTVAAPERLGLTDARREILLRRIGLSEYQQDRILVFLQPDRDPLGVGWNRRQSELAVGAGQLRGRGFRQGKQNVLGFLPRSVAPTDFIFSVIAEESGFMGACAVVGLYGVVLLAGLWSALRATDRFGRLLCTGLTAVLAGHVGVNVAMTMGRLPITGLPLPLLSYGGTFMVITLVSLGLIQSVHVHAAPDAPGGG